SDVCSSDLSCFKRANSSLISACSCSDIVTFSLLSSNVSGRMAAAFPHAETAYFIPHFRLRINLFALSRWLRPFADPAERGGCARRHSALRFAHFLPASHCGRGSRQWRWRACSPFPSHCLEGGALRSGRAGGPVGSEDRPNARQRHARP